MKTVESVGQRIVRLRKAKGLNQGDLAIAAGIDQSTVSDIENDKPKRFAAASLIAFAELLHTTPQYIMSGEETGDPREAELHAIFRRLNDQGREHLLSAARGAAAQGVFLETKPIKQTKIAA